MTNNIRKYEKARKHLINARESLDFWRDAYVDNERNKDNIDIFDPILGRTLREERRLHILKCIADAKRRISKFERLVY